MRTPISVTCDDASVREKLEAWVRRCGIVPPNKLSFRVMIGSPDTHKGSRRVFRQPAVEIRSGPPDCGVHISWVTAPAIASIPGGSSEASVVLSPTATSMMGTCVETFLITVLIFLLRRAGWHHVHGATARDPQGRGWLIAGDARAGKSTTAALLASRGWPVGTDDTAFLVDDDERVSVKACHGPIALRKGGYTLLGRNVGELLQRRQKMAVWPEDLGATWLPSVEPDMLLFTTVGDRVSKAEPIGAREALTELVRWSAWVVLEPELAQEHLDLLTKLAKQAQGYRVTLGRDLFDHPNRLAELIP